MIRAAGYAFALCLLTLAVAGVVGLVARQPFLFPSLGPTVMLFFDSPREPAASARNTLVGHGVGLAMGLACLHAFGLAGAPPATQAGLSASRVAAACLSVALTVLVLRLLGLPHPPAGATTLIVSLGVLTTLGDIAVMALAVVLVTAVGVTLNRVFGLRSGPPLVQ